MMETILLIVISILLVAQVLDGIRLRTKIYDLENRNKTLDGLVNKYSGILTREYFSKKRE